jgi:arginyl-tRNA synthetase
MRHSTQTALDAENLFDRLDAALRAVDPAAFRLVPALKPGGPADAEAVILDATAAEAGAEALAALPDVAAVEREERLLRVRFAAQPIAATGAALEQGRPAGLATADLHPGRRVIVDFCDPNATKALHAGHLRNIALGNATAASLAAAGAAVERQSHIGDAGRSMGEAMAGYVRYAGGLTPKEAGEKSDRFVGHLYARYVAEEGTPDDVAPEDAAVAHDLDERDDLAQRLIAGAQAGESEARALWLRVREWAVEGQDETLARLGVRFDRLIYDSDGIPAIGPLVELALERGVILREPSGALLYETGDESYPHLPLSRTDGFPTHHLRVVATWHGMMESEQGSELIHLSGDEWRANVVHVERLLRKLEPETTVLPSKHLVHGMVTAAGGELSSGKGDALLVDDLLDELVAHPRVRDAAHPGEERRSAPDDLVAIALFGFCLDRPLAKRLAWAPADVLLDPDANTGWRIALAWSKAWDPANDAGAAGQAPHDDDAYRFAVLQSQLHRRMLAPAVEALDLLKFVRFLGHLSGWYLDAPADPRVGRVMRATLAAGLMAAGLLRR